MVPIECTNMNRDFILQQSGNIFPMGVRKHWENVKEIECDCITYNIWYSISKIMLYLLLLLIEKMRASH